jgi:hypothetical protein
MAISNCAEPLESRMWLACPHAMVAWATTMASHLPLIFTGTTRMLSMATACVPLACVSSIWRTRLDSKPSLATHDLKQSTFCYPWKDSSILIGWNYHFVYLNLPCKMMSTSIRCCIRNTNQNEIKIWTTAR